MSKKSEERFEKQLDKLISDMEQKLRSTVGLQPEFTYMYMNGTIGGLYMAKYALAASKLGVLE